jgi:tetratricopeptide (TPR) repeat protein
MFAAGLLTRMDVFYCSGPERHTWVLEDDAAKCCNGYRRAQRTTRDARGATIEFYWQPIDAPADQPAAPPGPAPAPRDDSLGPLGERVAHLAFFRRLGELHGDSPRQHALEAGLLALRLIDRWLTRAATRRRPTFREFILVRRAIDLVVDERMRDVLLKLTDVLREFAPGEGSPIPTLLFGYGLLLETLTEWSVAIDVYETTCRYAYGADDRRGLPLVYCRLAFCHRHLGRVEEAARAYEQGRAVAREAGDRAAELRIRSGEGHLALFRGNVPEAVAIFDAVMREAREGGYRDAFARASHDRGHAALMQDADEQAAAYFSTALEAYAEPAQRERALEDLACALSRLGAREAARDAFLIAEATAVEHHTRAQAAINLLRLAAEDGDEIGFEHHRRAVGDPALLPVHLQAELHWRLADAYALLGASARAVEHYRIMGEIAGTHQLNEYTYIAEAGRRGQRSPTRNAAAVPESLAGVVDELRARRRRLQQ